MVKRDRCLTSVSLCKRNSLASLSSSTIAAVIRFSWRTGSLRDHFRTHISIHVSGIEKITARVVNPG